MDEKRKRFLINLAFGAVIAVVVMLITARRDFGFIHPSSTK